MGGNGKEVTSGPGQLLESGTSTGGTQENENVCRLDDEEEQLLLPGLLDDITFKYVVPRLPWRSFHILALVSRRWQQAIRSRQVYDARVRSKSTEALIVALVWTSRRSGDEFTLYHMSDNCCYQVLDFPQSHPGILQSCQSVVLDGKIYVLGRVGEVFTHIRGSSEMYVFDLVGQGGWQKCANLHEPRYNFGCVVKDGKIYVYGGMHRGPLVRGSEMYDPEKNIWSRIAPMPFLQSGHRECHQVPTLGEELPVYRGQICDRRYDELVGFAVPSEDDWKVVQPAPKEFLEIVFTARGKLYLLSWHGIAVCEDGENTWSHLHSNSFAALGPTGGQFTFLKTLPFNNELLLAVLYESFDMEEAESCVLQSTGFGTDIEEIVWHKVYFPPSCRSSESRLIGVIQL